MFKAFTDLVVSPRRETNKASQPNAQANLQKGQITAGPSVFPSTRRPPSLEIIDPSRGIKSAALEQFSRNAIDFINSGSNNSSPYSEQQLLGAYFASVYLFAALRRVSNLLSRVKIVAEIKQNGKWVRLPETHDLNGLFEEDASDMLSRMYYNHAIYGSTVVFKTKTRRAIMEEQVGKPIYAFTQGAVAGLEVLDRPMYELDEDSQFGDLKGLFVNQYSGTADTSAIAGRNYLQRKEFVYYTDWNPEAKNRGRPLVATCIHEAVANASIAQWISDYFTRGAMPFIAASLAEDDPALMTDADLKRYKRMIEENWQGTNASLRSIFFDRKVQFEQIGINASDVAAPDLNTTALEGIAATIGIDRELIVTSQGASQEGYDLLLKQAWTSTIIPTAERYIKAIRRDLGLPKHIRLVADLSEIPELEADREQKASTEKSLIDSSMQSVNEGRNRLNMAPEKLLDTYWKHDGKLVPLQKIIASAAVPPDDLKAYAWEGWENGLFKRSEALQLVGRQLPHGETDGYKPDIEARFEQIKGLFEDDIILRNQALTALGYPIPPGIDDGYKSELERGADYGDYVTGLYEKNLLTRGETMRLLDMGISLPDDLATEYQEDFMKRMERIYGRDAWVKELWDDNLLTRRQTSNELKLPMDENAIDGYLGETEILRDAIFAKKAEALTGVPADDGGGGGGGWRSLDVSKSYEEGDNELFDRYTDNNLMDDDDLDLYDTILDKVYVGETKMLTPIRTATMDTAEDDYLEGYGLDEGDVLETPYDSYGLVETIPGEVLPQAAQDEQDDYNIIDSLFDALDDEVETHFAAASDDIKSVEDTLSLILLDTVDMVVEPLADNSLYISLALKNNPTLMALQDKMKQVMPLPEKTNWQKPETFHVTLAYIKDASEEDAKHIEGLLPKQQDTIRLVISGLNSFSKPDTTVLKLEIVPSEELIQLQAKIMALIGAYGLPVSEYSHSDQYKPHITLAYTEPDTAIPELGISFVLEADTIQLGRNNYVTICEVSLEELDEVIQPVPPRQMVASIQDSSRAAQEDELSELAAWEKATLRNGPSKGLRFETHHIDASSTAAIKSQLKTFEGLVPQDIKAVFNAAKQRLLLLH